MKNGLPLNALIGQSEVVLTGVNLNTRAYDAEGNVLEGKVGEPRLEVCVMDELEKQTVTVKTLPPEIANLTAKQIEESLRTRKYILVDFINAIAKPYANKSGYGISYSIRADSAKIVKPAATPLPPQRSTKA
jgi:hypothetical protein